MSSSAETDQQKLSAAYVSYLRQLSGSWSSHSAARMLTAELISYIRPRFHRCSTPLKVRILTSLLYISPELLSQCSVELCHLLHNCETDRDDWVRKLSRLLQPYVATGHLDVREIDTETAYRTIKYLDEQRRLSGVTYRLKPPLEYSKVFNVTEDPFSADLDDNSCEDSNVSLPWEQLLGPGEQLPPYQPESQHFRCGGDFSLFMKEIQGNGFAALIREMRNVDAHHRSWRQQRLHTYNFNMGA